MNWQTNRGRGGRNHFSCRIKSEKGFSFLEVVLAVSILAVGLLAIGTMQTTSIKVNASAIDLTVRTGWGQDRLEKLIALPYDDLASGTDANLPDGHTVTWTVSGDDPLPNTKKIMVTVSKGGKTTELSDIVSKY